MPRGRAASIPRTRRLGDSGPAALALVLSLSLLACVTVGTTHGERTADTPGPLPSAFLDHMDTVAGDLDAYWTLLFRQADRAYQPPVVSPYRRGAIPQTICAQGTEAAAWTDSAQYCFDDRVLTYDSDFVADVFTSVNRDAASAILAHEWGHHLQGLTARPRFTLQQELQADCYAGVFLGGEYGSILGVDAATQAMEQLAAAGNERYRQSAWFDVSEHGSAGLRLIAFTMGSIIGAISFGNTSLCEGYAAYVPEAPIEIDGYRLSHLPGFEHRVDAGGVAIRRDDIGLRVEPMPDSVLPSRDATPEEQVFAAWQHYAATGDFEVLSTNLDPAIVSERPTGIMITMGYAATTAEGVRLGTMTLHRSDSGDALIIDSAYNAPDLDAAIAASDRELLLANMLGIGIEWFVCTPGQSGERGSPDYFFSCDLEQPA